MNYIIHFVLGFSMAYIGLIPPGMINMTTVRTTLQNGRNQATKFAAGASLIVLIQASIALIFANYFNANPGILDKLSVAGGFVFLILSVFFFFQGRKKFKAKGKEQTKGFFFTGMFMSSINMLSIPFYLGLSTLLTMKELLILEQPFISFFVIGASLGAFGLFLSYSYFAKVIETKAQFIASNINYILSALFLVLGVITLYNAF